LLKIVNLQIGDGLEAFRASEMGEVSVFISRIAPARIDEGVVGLERTQVVDLIIANEVSVVAGAVASNQGIILAFGEEIERR